MSVLYMVRKSQIVTLAVSKIIW